MGGTIVKLNPDEYGQKAFIVTFRLLILGGSSEAFTLAGKLADKPGLEMVTSFAGRTRTRRPVPGGFRVGGFGGVSGLAEYLRQEKINAIIDATHPFADRIKAHADEAAKAARTPVLHILRPEWQPEIDDDWLMAPSMDAAARMVPNDAGLVFLTVGRTELTPFTKRPEIRFLARIIDPPDDGVELGSIDILLARGPFRLEDERELFTRHRIGCLVTKNSGGDAAGAKLQVARELGVAVIMVQRPAPPAGTKTGTVADALTWLEGIRNGKSCG